MQVFHLSPQGNDQWTGRLAAPARNRRNGPWATLAGARDNLRALRTAGKITGPVTVLVHDGRYALTETVAFNQHDSHTHYQAAPRAKPVFDGGEPLAGWKVGERNGRTEWTLDLPDVAADKWNFRSLFVNGRRAPRARLPKFSPDEKSAKNVFHIGAIKHPAATGLFAGSDTFQPKPGDVQNWASLPDAEFVVLHYWIEERLPQPSFNPSTGWLRFARRSAFNLYEAFAAAYGNRALARYYVDNLFEALTEPGEWYLNRETGRLYYLPRPGETPANTVIHAPRLHSFIHASGQFFNDSIEACDAHATPHLRGLEFTGLTFRHGDWFSPLAQLPPFHQAETFGKEQPIGGSVQAAHVVPGALKFRAARDCAVRDCTIEHVGLYGLEFDEGCRNCTAVGNHLHDLGAGGIRGGGTDMDGHLDGRTGHLTITDNTIHHIGRIFHQGVGVFLGHAFDCNVAHNHIHHACYTGISTGWTWGYRETPSRNNRIEHNLIHDIGTGILSDMGGIYTLGVQPGTVVRGNHLHHIWSQDYGGWGIYLDEGTSHLLIEHNLVHDTKDAPFNIHFARENVVRHNIFARGQNALTSVSRIEPGQWSANYFNNIVIGPSARLFCGGYKGNIAHGALVSNANCFWSPGGKLPDSGNPRSGTPGAPLRVSWTAWKKAGHDSLSVVADPKLTEGRKTWRLAKNSPALKLGFKPWDWSKCGPRPKAKR
ncbi:MAG: right-handed parallel beta-helix repeat-containing protein [Opitutaceae bacterium]|nr:right-handed parallel beta-helix repeat-containing protein [Opitutaceae bacterium]MBP9913665.1 right-handed parallel beta-helix repeat-containing protein [Opitutaceae bacterium]